MKIRPILLYITGLFLLIFGNRDLWDEVREERREAEKNQKLLTEANRDLEKRFEVQQLEYDSLNNQWKNPHYYFQLVNASYINFKALNKTKRTSIESDDDEIASDSN